MLLIDKKKQYFETRKRHRKQKGKKKYEIQNSLEFLKISSEINWIQLV